MYGKDIQVESDHKPLESIFKKTLAPSSYEASEDAALAAKIQP